MSEAKLEAYVFTSVFIGVLLVVGALFYPFIGAIATALVLATLTYPLHTWIASRTKRPGLSACIVVLLVTLAILVPLSGLFLLLIEEVGTITSAITNLNLGTVPAAFAGVWHKIIEGAPFIGTIDLRAIVQTALQNLSGYAANVVTGAADVLLKVIITIIALFYFLKDGRVFLLGFISLSPLADDEDVQILHKLQAVSRSLIRGTLVIALLQGLLTGIGFLLFGIPNPVLWGSVAAIGSLVPTIGTSVVSIPGIIYLVVTGQYVAAMGLATWAMFFVGLIDNAIGPKLMGSGASIHPLFVLLSVLGGLWMFGMAGFLVGPLLFGLLVALFEIYVVKVRAMHTQLQ
ncbi:MAG: AI-2E family transporter [Candidatus Pacebacteria bacterium]|nr:AI-2E family transporter [Candidatus Paceibacterota bacterium]